MKRRAPATPPGAGLFEAAASAGRLDGPPAPLAERMRPRRVEELLGQGHLLGEGRFLAEAIRQDRLPSLILWGPPGSGKTTLAGVVAAQSRAELASFSAVLSGLPELRVLIGEARERRLTSGRRTLLFVDEIHRFNRAQQDAFLPHLENGTVTLIGATTENPSFSVNAAVLSRCRVLRLDPLPTEALRALLERALAEERGLGRQALVAEPEALDAIARSARGDARRALGWLEAAASLLPMGATLTVEHVARARGEDTLLHDKSGEEHYNVTSALIKSMRGSDPDAAIYWLMRLLEAGDDPLFVLRRLVIFASEDVGNADPRALTVAMDADAAFRRLGMPEGLYPIAHACLYLAACPKSDAVGRAFQGAQALIAEHGALPVPLHLRNATSGVGRAEGYGKDYRSPHDEPAPGAAPRSAQVYLPPALAGTQLYFPSDQGLEQQIRDRLARLRGR